MGRLLYGTRGVQLDADDTTLAHLRAVMVQKLRRGEPFTLSWSRAGLGYSVWVNQSSELSWMFEGDGELGLDRDRLELLMIEASSNNGLRIGETSVDVAIDPVD